MLPFSDCGIGKWIGLHVHNFLSGVPQEVTEDVMIKNAKKKDHKKSEEV